MTRTLTGAESSEHIRFLGVIVKAMPASNRGSGTAFEVVGSIQEGL